MHREAGADGNGCDGREVSDWRSRVLEQADLEAKWKSASMVAYYPLYYPFSANVLMGRDLDSLRDLSS